MLQLETDGGRSLRFVVVDIHHHIGAEGQTRNLNPKEPNGSYDFFRSIQFSTEFKAGLATQLGDADRFKFHSVGGEFCAPPPAMRILEASDGRASKAFHGTWAVDMSVAFPMHDDFRSNEDVEYRASNRRVSKITQTFPNGLRFVPWGRVNPKDGQTALEELGRAVREDGIRGLKLHPKSDGFEIASDELREVLKEAARHSVPVIFHTDWKSDRRAIIEAADDALVDLADTGEARAIAGMKVILGHFGWSADDEMVGLLSHPCVFGEVSGIHGRGAMEFFQIAREAFPACTWDSEALTRRTSRPDLLRSVLGPCVETDWSRKVMFGSDIPFLNQNNSIDVITTLLSRELDLTSQEVAHVLGLTALRVLCPFRSYMEGHGAVAKDRSASGPSFTGTMAGGGAFMGSLLGAFPSGIKTVSYSPSLTGGPHPRHLEELGLVQLQGRDGRRLTIRLGVFEGLDLSHLSRYTDTNGGPWLVGGPVDGEVARVVGDIGRFTDHGEVDPLVAEMIPGQGPGVADTDG